MNTVIVQLQYRPFATLLRHYSTSCIDI